MEQIPSFYSFNIKPNEKYNVVAPVDTSFSASTISILPDENTPENGRIVLWVDAPVASKEQIQSVAVASLRVGTAEVVKVDFVVDCLTPITFYTKGDNITVTVSGYATGFDPLQVTKVEEKKE
ncbi:hypothetical protein TVAG_211610 [Trichomonas vaginalis G3]|uniref:Nucleoplasmin-like domain-containing protein n=1 Tax=Trichomonas vaginalis (strain ATCC PRA-98 / G3) TaxID=412133 RepID=A2EL01_TRIV3|nr:32 kDa heat shock protein-related family [Trichomonas vaginalis G3]EAY06709.1 hypothetical protein TVAG_211610 [Trichomonas vaginalis G3]KAI5491675.1 32 kDa heat shock protein-related family [Trichomonas vaginalis G3]|eukprot:XP_001318932.1 hypothetical protein [Trichomonas vaginalis G3]